MAYAAPVVAVATSNVNVGSPTSAVFDGITVPSTGSSSARRVLLPNQTNQVQAGVWIFNGVGVAMQRPALPDQYATTNVLDNNTQIPVTNGALYAGTCWGLDPAQVVTVDTTTHTLTRIVLPPIQVRAATNHNISLSSITNVDGVTTSSTPPLTGNGLPGSDLILLKNQTSSANNGVYWVNTTGASARATEPLIPGREVLVNQGTVNAHTLWSLVTAGPLVVGTTLLTFSRQFTKVNLRDWNAKGDGVTDDSAAIANAIASAATSGGTVTLPQSGGAYLVGAAASVTIPAGVRLSFEQGALLQAQSLVTINGDLDAADTQQIFAGGTVWAMTQTGAGPSVGLLSTGAAWSVTSLVVTITSSSTFEYALNGGTPVTGLAIPGASAIAAGVYAVPGTSLQLLFPIVLSGGTAYSSQSYAWTQGTGGGATVSPSTSGATLAVSAGNATAPTLEYAFQVQILASGPPGTGWFALSVDGGPLTFVVTEATATSPIRITVPGVSLSVGQTIYLSGSAGPLGGLTLPSAYTIHHVDPVTGVASLTGTAGTGSNYTGTTLFASVFAAVIPTGLYQVPSSVANGVNLTFSGSYSAGAIYTWTTTGPVAFAVGSDAALAVTPNHFGAGQLNADLGAIINACDAALGTTPGDIIVQSNGGNLAKAVVLGSFHRLRLGAGTYTATVGSTGPNSFAVIWCLSNNSTLEGSGPQTILQESTGYGVFGPGSAIIVVGDYLLSKNSLSGGSSNIAVRNLQVQGVETNPLNSTISAIYFGNCAHLWIECVLVTQSSGFSITFGAGSVGTPSWTPATAYGPVTGNCVLPPVWTKLTNYAANQAVIPPEWLAGASYSVGDTVTWGSSLMTPGFYFKCTVAGTSGANPPTWNSTLYGTTLDSGTLQWECLGVTQWYVCTTPGTSASSVSGAPNFPPSILYAGDELTTPDGSVVWTNVGQVAYFACLQPGVSAPAMGSTSTSPLFGLQAYANGLGGTVTDNSVEWFNAGIGAGPCATDVHVKNCSVVGSGSQAINGINAADFHIEGNHIIGTAARSISNGAFIDCETNKNGDLVLYFSISDNIIDARPGDTNWDSAAGPTGGISAGGILVQNDGGLIPSNIGGGTISGNIIIAGNIGMNDGKVTTGIGLNGVCNTLVSGNYLVSCYQGGIYATTTYGAPQGNISITSNTFNACGVPYGEAILLAGVTNSRVTGNTLVAGPQWPQANAIAEESVVTGLVISGLSSSSGVLSVTTSVANYILPGVFVRLVGLPGIVQSTGHTNANVIGPAAIASPSSTAFDMSVATTGSYVTVSNVGPVTALGGGAYSVTVTISAGGTVEVGAGDTVIISGVEGWSPLDLTNGTFTVVSTTSTTFSYHVTPSMTPSGTYTSGGMFGQIELVCLGNYIANNYLDCNGPPGAQIPPYLVTQGYSTLVDNFLGGCLQLAGVGGADGTPGGVLQSTRAGQGLSRNAVTLPASGNYYVTLNDYLVEIGAGASSTVTLPSAANALGSAAAGAALVNQAYIIKNVSANSLTVATYSSQTIDGAGPGSIASMGILRVYSDGSNWWTW